MGHAHHGAGKATQTIGSLEMLKVYLKCCLHKWKEFESVSLRPSNSLEMAAAGTALHGSTRNHSFCLRRASEWLFVFVGTQPVCLNCSLIDSVNLGIILPLLKVQEHSRMQTHRCWSVWPLHLQPLEATLIFFPASSVYCLVCLCGQ